MDTHSTRFVEEKEELLGRDRLTEGLLGKIREMIWALADAELTEVLAAGRYARAEGRRGYRHGSKRRELTTGLGRTTIHMPRGRVVEGGEEKEWESHLIRRYARRCGSVNAAVLGAYLSGANGRRIKGALSPLLRGAPLSKSAVSRVVGRLTALFEQWRRRDLDAHRYIRLYLDAIVLRVRMAGKVVSAPVLVALGVRADGQKEVLDLELLTSESGAAWGGFVDGLIARKLKRPRIVIIDGSPGLRRAVEASWPGILVQRCTVHKLRNIERHTPRHALEEVRADYHRITEAESLGAARAAHAAFIAQWSRRAPKVAESLKEAGEELLTFYRFPKSQWKSLRSTNTIERLNEEFRRRVKTQGSLPDATAAERLLFGLLIGGQIRMRRVDGWQELHQQPETLAPQAA